MKGLQSAVLLLLFLAVCALVGVITAEDVCLQPKERGPCKRKLSSYYFDPYMGNCRYFSYGGCGGNGNRFDSRENCQTTCLKREVCNALVDPGMCMAHTTSYFYNSSSETCETFNYGGCDGNGNRFNTETACHAVCMKDKICQQPPDRGRCRGFMPMLYYNSTTATCEEFIYGGCGGNGNRFRSIKVCQTVCADKKAICNQPAEPGECREQYPRYYYNSTSAACEPFIYTGCKGNGNNFVTIQACQQLCASSQSSSSSSSTTTWPAAPPGA